MTCQHLRCLSMAEFCLNALKLPTFPTETMFSAEGIQRICVLKTLIERLLPVGSLKLLRVHQVSTVSYQQQNLARWGRIIWVCADIFTIYIMFMFMFVQCLHCFVLYLYVCTMLYSSFPSLLCEVQRARRFAKRTAAPLEAP